MAQGKLIVITGPSGVGKGTIVRSLLQRHPELCLSVSTTTRNPRLGEIEGIDYYYTSQDEFKTAIAKTEFLEWAEYAGNYYGTPKTKVKEVLEQGKSIILEIELLGARAIAQCFPDARRILILPPSLAELEARIRKRGKDPELAIEKRLARAKEEIAAKDEFEFQIINHDLEQAIKEVEEAIFSY
ncbi:Guanylate kinase [Hyella patelloides LEGE 07179]|uniref:Guanylate kinase n=1 Tax=Hyella patelloides LEGE 07179 TaxID=945734 RepID=A0A563VJ19_9CYAN|nr:guanylate kinase [Hyella patelloides]VEP11317.1 Guanylate kinase [Hyella patelloides LEGE 07179]